MSIKNKILLSISIFTGIYILTFFVSTNKVHSEALEVLERQTNLLKKEIVSNIDKEKVILANKNREILFKALSDSTEKTARYASQQVDNLFSTALNDLVFLSRNYNGNAVDSFLKNRTSLVNSITIKKASFKNNRWIVDGLVSKKRIPLYKEFTVFNKNGDEVFKIPQTAVKKNIKLKNNTYLNSETYFSNSLSLEPKQHFISKQVGLYVKSSKFKDVTTNDNFKELGFLGLENPLGRKHEGFIRLIYRINNDLFATLLLDSSHLKSILDYINPVDGKTNLMPDASSGNYSFMQDYLGNTITHPRNPFIMGSINGEDVLPWLSEKNYKSIQSGKKLKDLREYVVEDKDSFSKEQLRNGLIPTNCKFLSFAPQCKQWKDIHETKNIGSNIIEWADKKMVSAVSSLEFKHFVKGKESQYGYVIVNRSLSEVNQLIATSFKQINNTLKNSENKLSMIPYEIESKVHKIINEAISSLSIVTFLLIFFILVFSFYILRDFDKRIQFLVSLTNDVFKGKKHSMPKDSTDELSKLESALKQASNDLNTSYTEIKEKEKIILEMEKEKAITELSQDVAHDMRTPIAALNLLTKKLKNSMPYDFYKEIRNISERIQDIANNLLTAKNSPAISEQIEELPLQIVIRRILSEKKRICKK
jgi:biopolymer transport protein ExbB/TolQ